MRGGALDSWSVSASVFTWSRSSRGTPGHWSTVRNDDGFVSFHKLPVLVTVRHVRSISDKVSASPHWPYQR